MTSVSLKPYTEHEFVVTDRLTARSDCAGPVCFGGGELLRQEELRSHDWLLKTLKSEWVNMAARDRVAGQGSHICRRVSCWRPGDWNLRGVTSLRGLSLRHESWEGDWSPRFRAKGPEQTTTVESSFLKTTQTYSPSVCPTSSYNNLPNILRFRGFLLFFLFGSSLIHSTWPVQHHRALKGNHTPYL